MNHANLHVFLKSQLGAQDIAHSGRDLYVHLTGTHDLLKDWGATEAIRIAGLFHSIYGTWHFRHKAFSITRRQVIRDLIGEEAEFLVYVFCVAERPKAFLAVAQTSDIRLIDHHTKSEMALTPDQLDALLEIETANLIEQRGAIRGLLERLSSTRVSNGAKLAIADYLAVSARAPDGTAAFSRQQAPASAPP